MVKHAVIVVLTLALLATLFAQTSFAQTSSSEPECMGFTGFGLGRAEKSIASGEMIQVNAKGAAPAVEAWMKEQVSQGKSRFVPLQMFQNGAVLCAW